MPALTYLLPIVIWGGVLIVCVLCIYVAWRALFGDRGMGQRRCPKCWYDMAYSPGMMCAECGHVAQREEDFRRTRRRSGIAAAAIFICVALVLAVNDQMNQQGFLRHMPTGMLVWILPITGGMDGPIGREIDRRATQRQLTAAHWASLMERCADGDWTARPPSDDWIEDYGDFIENWRNRFINDATLEATLSDIPPLLRVRTRDVWPEGVPLAVAVSLHDWWPAGMECRVRAVPRLPGQSAAADTSHAGSAAGAAAGPAPGAITFYRSGEIRFRPSPFTMYLPPLPPGEHEITIDFTVDRRRMIEMLPRSERPMSEHVENGVNDAHQSGASELEAADDATAADDRWEPVGAFAITLPARVEGRLGEMMQPVTDAGLDALVQQAFGTAVRWTGGGLSPVRFGINAQATFTPEFDDTAVGVSVELEHAGVVARRLNLWWIAGTLVADQRRNYGFEINYENLLLLRTLAPDSEGWQLRVRSDPLLALRAGVSKQYWQGEVILPINLRVNQTQAPPRMWWTEGEAIEAPTPNEDGQAPPPSRRGGRRAM